MHLKHEYVRSKILTNVSKSTERMNLEGGYQRDRKIKGEGERGREGGEAVESVS